MENKNLNAKEYFDIIKNAKNVNTDEALDKFYDSALLLLHKYNKTGQQKSIKRLLFIIDTIPKERELIKLGVNTFVYREDITTFINKVENKDVKIIELENYPREIPDELVPVIEATNEIFDNFYVVFTDYTGEVEREIEKERRERDPILFGTFIDNNSLHDRFYYLGDWEDEYCDLTLDKLIEVAGENIAKTITTPITKEELILEYQRLSENNKIENNVVLRNKIDEINKSIAEDRIKRKPNIFKRIRSVFSGK